MADDSSRIPGRHGTTPFSKSGGLTLPPSGTVVMASVEEDLGDGVYTLKWGRNRIQVTSKTGLTKGQSLILKSENSPEGKPRLVVQGPALPNKHATGRVAYGPNIGTARNAAAQSGQSGQSHSAQPAPAQVQTGQGVAAGVSRVDVPSGAAAPKNAASLMGLVLEPLEDWRSTAEAIIESANTAKTPEEEKKEKEKKPGRNNCAANPAPAAATAKRPSRTQGIGTSRSASTRPR